MKNRDLVNFVNAKESLSVKRLPMKLSYALKLNYEKTSASLKAYIKQYEEIMENLNNAKSKEEKEDFMEQISELLEAPVTDDIRKVVFDVIEKCDEEKFDALTVKELEAISFMIE